jgi:hypothetical protein
MSFSPEEQTYTSDEIRDEIRKELQSDRFLFENYGSNSVITSSNRRRRWWGESYLEVDRKELRTIWLEAPEARQVILSAYAVTETRQLIVLDPFRNADGLVDKSGQLVGCIYQLDVADIPDDKLEYIWQILLFPYAE